MKLQNFESPRVSGECFGQHLRCFAIDRTGKPKWQRQFDFSSTIAHPSRDSARSCHWRCQTLFDAEVIPIGSTGAKARSRFPIASPLDGSPNPTHPFRAASGAFSPTFRFEYRPPNVPEVPPSGCIPFFGQTAARQSLQSKNSAQRLFLMQHLKAVIAVAPLSISGASPSSPQKMGRTPSKLPIFENVDIAPRISGSK